MIVPMYSDGVRIYRKTLRDGRNTRSEAVQLKVRIRSRQQRVIFFCHMVSMCLWMSEVCYCRVISDE